MKNKNLWKPSKFVYKNNKLIASRNTDEVGLGSRMMADLVANHYDTYISEYAHGKLLDLGCGKVPLFEAYKNSISENTCVDWINSAHQNKFIDFECDLNEKLPFEDKEFDTIILSDVLEHICEPLKLWAEMSRILSKEGKIIMNVPFYYWLHEQPHDYFRYTEFSLRRFAEINKMKIILLTPIGGAPEILTDIFAKTSLHVPIIGRLLSTYTQKAASIFIKTKPGKNLSKQTAERFPLGYFLVAEK